MFFAGEKFIPEPLNDELYNLIKNKELNYLNSDNGKYDFLPMSAKFSDNGI